MENYKTAILDVLQKISDLDFQRDVWVKQAYWDIVLNFGEAVNLLDDYCFFEEVEKKDISLPDIVEQNNMECFIKDILEYEEPSDPLVMLVDSKWIEIAKRGKRVKERLEEKWVKGEGGNGAN